MSTVWFGSTSFSAPSLVRAKSRQSAGFFTEGSRKNLLKAFHVVEEIQNIVVVGLMFLFSLLAVKAGLLLLPRGLLSISALRPLRVKASNDILNPSHTWNLSMTSQFCHIFVVVVFLFLLPLVREISLPLKAEVIRLCLPE